MEKSGCAFERWKDFRWEENPDRWTAARYCSDDGDYGVKIVSSPIMTLNGANHDALCEKLGVDKSMQAVAVLLIGRADTDAVTSATTRETLDTRTTIIE